MMFKQHITGWKRKTTKEKSRWKTSSIRRMTQQQDGLCWAREWQMQIEVWLHWIFLSKTVLMLEIMQRQSCITEDCCHLKLKTTNSWNRNSELLPKHLSIMQSCHIPNVLCYRILFFHLWWTPRVQSKQSDMVQLSLSLHILLALPKPSNFSPCQKKHGFDISAAPDICSANLGGNLKPSCPADQTECRAGCSSRSEVWLGYVRSYGAWKGATNWHYIYVLLLSCSAPIRSPSN